MKVLYLFMAAPGKLTRHILTPLRLFMKDSRATGIVLFVCTACSLIIANTSIGNNYLSFINTSFHFPVWLHLPHSLLHWINDGAMALFFFQVGMEIKRELLQGELSDARKAAMPAAAAIGGILVPAGIYVLFNHSNEYTGGWGIPMATDIAFSLGVLSILGKRVPSTLKIFLMALAIIDDLGAIVVIAVFYGEKINTNWLLISAGITIIMFLLYRFRQMSLFIVVLTGIALWYAVFNCGIHPTIASVITAMFVPVKKLSKYEHALHPVVNFMVLPLFALANTAIIFPGNITAGLSGYLSIGIITGLVMGKPIGIALFSWLMVKTGLGIRPSGAGWWQLVGVGALAGIGFTMSIFISMLAFPGDTATTDLAKLAVLIASLIATLMGILLLRAKQ